MTSDVQDAQSDLAESKQRFQESLRVAGETGTRLAVEVRKKVTPTLVVAVVVGAAAVGVALVVARAGARPRWRAPRRPSLTGQLARAGGMWLLRAVALRVARELAANYRDSHTPPMMPAHPVT